MGGHEAVEVLAGLQGGDGEYVGAVLQAVPGQDGGGGGLIHGVEHGAGGEGDCVDAGRVDAEFTGEAGGGEMGDGDEAGGRLEGAAQVTVDPVQAVLRMVFGVVVPGQVVDGDDGGAGEGLRDHVRLVIQHAALGGLGELAHIVALSEALLGVAEALDAGDVAEEVFGLDGEAALDGHGWGRVRGWRCVEAGQDVFGGMEAGVHQQAQAGDLGAVADGLGDFERHAADAGAGAQEAVGADDQGKLVGG